MKTNQTATNNAIAKLGVAKAMRTLYFTRVAFSVIWVTLVAVYAPTSPQVAAVLLIIYPAWDVVGTFWDIKINRQSNSLKPQYTNAVISVATTFAVGLALNYGVPAALIVFGVWAGLTGIIQLILGVQRRKEFGGQWPMILSGGQSLIAGVTFAVLAHQPTMGIASLAGYSGFGAFYYVLAAIRLTKSTQAVHVQTV
ncbi:DUF308 domain-containing protein [Mucilaginibacter sp. FT3.2]|uniref:DUF308 domain-containing protein n=1 Tax=Mucilaginibacter sp. FT3.2 TaxID=2723090 RepID=UPI0016081A01|nr:DUF308 domain-containing protein [Mucilaginibacter sp. FT3.2]MBB6230255.1 uncharacterized membrane protein HdeD (DUF308 family) [Mucilaginibacter sp. FT3.2]